jgi:Lar family restriction alleviation protein
MNDIKLLSCPFCGGNPYIERYGTNRCSTIILCEDCGCKHESGDSGNSVGSSWNRRFDCGANKKIQ